MFSAFVAVKTRKMESHSVMENQNPTSLTTQEVATYIGFEPSTVRSWRTRGVGPRFNGTGRATRYTAADLANWCEEEAGNISSLEAAPARAHLAKLASTLRRDVILEEAHRLMEEAGSRIREATELLIKNTGALSV
jgi:hypothetical protein